MKTMVFGILIAFLGNTVVLGADHRNLDWGMTEAEVLKAQMSNEFWDCEKREGRLIDRIELLGYGCEIRYSFRDSVLDDGGLKTIEYMINDYDITEIDRYSKEVYLNFISALTMKYGDPLPEETSEIIKKVPAPSTSGEDVFIHIKKTKRTIWMLEDKMINVSLFRDKNYFSTFRVISVSYHSKPNKKKITKDDLKNF